MNMQRRGFLKTLSAGAALSMVPFANQALAQARKSNSLRARHLIVVLASGGWDTTMSLDPKVGVSAIDSAVGERLTVGGLPILAHASRPSVTRYFEDYGQRTAIINGLQIRSLVHTDGIKRIMTGDPTGQEPDIAAVVADNYGREAPIPYLALGANSLPGNLVGLSGRTGVIQQVTGLVRPEAELPQVQPTSALPLSREPLVTRFLRRRADVLGAKGARGRVSQQIGEYKSGLDRMESFKRFARETGAFTDREFVAELGTQAEIAVGALRDGLSHTVFLELGGWDSHAGGDAQQSERHEAMFSGLHTLNRRLDEEGLTEDTAILVVSEMGRTPRKNAQGGKDHWPVSSAMVIGGGVRSGVYGASDDTLNARSIDLTSGVASNSGQQLQTGNLLTGVLEWTGVDPSDSTRHHLSGFQPFNACFS
jgi:hypothetical protein